MNYVLSILLFVTAVSGQGYPGYGPSAAAEENPPSESVVIAPQAPIAPPRVPLPNAPSSSEVEVSSGPSRGYRPPPPPLRRDVESIGKCSFDSSKWQIEPQSAIARAIMFDRSTGLSCEECLEKCGEFQDASSEWICRTLTYDNNFKICDLFAINGTEYPYYLTHYVGRDYFVYLPALPPADAEIKGIESESSVSASAQVEVEATTITNPPAENVEVEASFTGDNNIESAGEAAPAVLEVVTPGAPEEASSAAAAEEAAPAVLEIVTPAPSVPEASSAAPVPTGNQIAVAASSASNSEYQAVYRSGASKTGSSVCSSGEVTRYTQFESAERTRPGDDVGLSPAKTREDCAAACDREQLQSCSSAVYSPSGCELSVSAANHTESDALTPSSTSVYLEKTCIDKKLAAGTRLFFPAVSNYLMVGLVQEVADANTLAECQIACLRAEKEYGFSCKSGMWYPTDKTQNCVLNAHNRVTRPNVFVREDQGVNMVYFEIAYENDNDKGNSITARFRDVPVADVTDTKWTRWSQCGNESTAMRYRYLKCGKKDIRKCPKESVTCRHLPNLQIQKLDKVNECKAVVDSRGRKRCPHGSRVNSAGIKEYCTNPVDC